VVSLSIYPYWFNNFLDDFKKFDRNEKGEVSFRSFKALTECDDKKVFDAICMNNARNTFKRCDFNAAILSLCEFGNDDLYSVFQRIDVTGKGYITHEDILRSLMVDDTISKDELRMSCSEMCKTGNISFEQFVELLG